MTTAQLEPAALLAVRTYGPDVGLREPDAVTDLHSPMRTCVWDPDLSAAEQTALSFIVSATAATVDITPAERQALEPFLVTGRAFLAQSQAEFIALGQNARDRMLFDNVSAQWRVIFRLLRD